MNYPEIIKTEKSKDGKTIKFLQRLSDGHIIETSYFNLDEHIICVSSQVGCPLGCLFCATTMPISKTDSRNFIRNLTKKEICQQINNVLRRSIKKQDKKPILLSYAGMGEPLLNYKNVTGSVKKISSSVKNVKQATIITSGVSPSNIKRLAREKFKIKINLQFSLHAPVEKLRRIIMPNVGPIKNALLAVKYFSEIKNTPVKINYMLIDNLNDSLKDASDLSKLVRGNNFVIKLMFMNKFGVNKPSSSKRYREFKRFLRTKGLDVVEFKGDGLDIKASCGQLRRYYYKCK